MQIFVLCVPEVFGSKQEVASLGDVLNHTHTLRLFLRGRCSFLFDFEEIPNSRAPYMVF